MGEDRKLKNELQYFLKKTYENFINYLPHLKLNNKISRKQGRLLFELAGKNPVFIIFLLLNLQLLKAVGC